MPQAAKPAVQSGPGALSQRTDGGVASKQAQRYISGMPNYGDGQDLANLQAQAPLAATNMPTQPAVQAPQPSQGQQQPSQAVQQQAMLTPLTAPTQRPNEPVTAGGALGPGVGPTALGIMPGQQVQGGQSAKQAVQALAAHPDASPALKQLAAKLGL